MFSKGKSKKFDSKDKEILATTPTSSNNKGSKTSNTTKTAATATTTTTTTSSPSISPASSKTTQKTGSRKASSSSTSSSSSKKTTTMDKTETEAKTETAVATTSTTSGVASKFVAGTATTSGNNRYNEDRAVIIPNLGGRSTHAYFAIYDGHGGTKCSVFCTKFLADLVSKEPNFETDINSAIVNGFIKADKRFLKKQESCGSTVNVAIVTDSKVIVANAGDCRCVASIGKKAKAFSVDHKPSDPIERQRIEKAHHEVTTETILVKGKRIKMCRIDGMISVSRGIGDPDFKDEYDLPPEEQAISCIPDITEYPINSDLRFFVIACDGLWDVMSNEEVIDYIEERLKGASEPTEELANSICEQLVNDAVSKYSSTDNVTAVLVLFKRS